VITFPNAAASGPGRARHQRWTWIAEVASASRPVVVLSAAVLAPVALGLVLLPYRSQIPNATVALGFAALVWLLAAVGTRFTAFITAVSAAICFDVDFTQPYGSLAISHPQDIEITLLLLVGGLIIGQLAARNRGNRVLLAQQSDDLAHIRSIAELMAEGVEPDVVVGAVAGELQSLLGLSMCWFDTSQPGRPTPTIARDGNVRWGPMWWGVRTLGLPGKEITLDVEHDGRHIGRYALVAEGGTKVRRDQLLTAVTLADQAGAALGGGQRRMRRRMTESLRRNH
jgi:hypothetical protein